MCVRKNISSLEVFVPDGCAKVPPLVYTCISGVGSFCVNPSLPWKFPTSGIYVSVKLEIDPSTVTEFHLLC